MRQSVKRFEDIHLHCNASSVERISKISTFPLIEKFLRTPVATFTFTASFDVWACQAKVNE